MRNDLGPEQKAVQAAHACIEMARWMLPVDEAHPHLVMCVVRNEAKLREVMSRLDSQQIRFKEFREPDRDNETTALATEPLRGDRRTFFKKYQLLRYG